MFERFTPRARSAIVHAQEEARELHSHHLGTEHLLLGVLRVEDGVGARALAELGVRLEDARAEVERVVGRGDAQTPGQIPFTPQAKRALDLALREALRLGHNYIGTEHLLLGLVREGDDPAAAILRERGATVERVEETVLRLVGPGPGLGPVLRGRTAGPPWLRGPRRPPSYEVRTLEGAPETWAAQLNAWAGEGFSLHTLLQHEGRTVAILARRR